MQQLHTGAIVAVLAVLPVMAHAAPAGFVTRQGDRLFLDGREYRAVGVNVPHLHQAYFGTWFHIQEIYGGPEKARQAMVEAIEDASKSGIAFIRFFASPGYPRDQAMLYDKERERYWQLMDELFALCRRNNVKLIPSLGTIPGPYAYMGETGRAILDPNSKTYRFVHQYVREFVARYKDDPTVLMWELVNEGMLAADVEMQGRKLLPKGVYPPGFEPRLDGSNEDSLHFSDYQRLYREQTAFIKGLDPNHLVTSGDAHVRPECTSRRETFPNFRFRSDTWREWLGNNLASQPEPLDVLSFHFYGSDEVAKAGEPWAGLDGIEWIRRVTRVVHASGAPVFIGELGFTPNNHAEGSQKWLCRCLDAVDEEGISLTALWVWHFPWQKDLTMDSQGFPEVVRRAGEFNWKWAGLK